MSVIKDKTFSKPFASPVLVTSPSKRKREPAKRARFAKMCMHVVKWCVEADNLAMLPVIAYLSLNSYNPEWRYNTAAIHSATGLNRKTVAKCLAKLERIGVLTALDSTGSSGSLPRSVKPYELNLLRFVELLETVDTDGAITSMGIQFPFLEKEVSTSMGIQSPLIE